MFSDNSSIDLIITTAVLLLLAIILWSVVTIISIIHNKIFHKTAVKEWFKQRKYLLLFNLSVLLMVVVLVCFMCFGLWGMFALIPSLCLFIAFFTDRIVKRRHSHFFEEATEHVCKCGNPLILLYVTTPSGEQRPLYLICRTCQQKYKQEKINNPKKT